MFAKLRPRRSTKAEWETINPVLKEGEMGIEVPDTGVGTGLCKFKLGDGYNKWKDLPYAFDGTAASAVYGGTPSVSHDIFLRSGTTDEWETLNPILGIGEIVFDITMNAFKCGDGEHVFTNLDYIGYNWEMDQEYDFGDIDIAPVVPTANDKDYDFGDIDLL